MPAASSLTKCASSHTPRYALLERSCDAAARARTERRRCALDVPDDPWQAWRARLRIRPRGRGPRAGTTCHLRRLLALCTRVVQAGQAGTPVVARVASSCAGRLAMRAAALGVLLLAAAPLAFAAQARARRRRSVPRRARRARCAHGSFGSRRRRGASAEVTHALTRRANAPQPPTASDQALEQQARPRVPRAAARRLRASRGAQRLGAKVSAVTLVLTRLPPLCRSSPTWRPRRPTTTPRSPSSKTPPAGSRGRRWPQSRQT